MKAERESENCEDWRGNDLRCSLDLSCWSTEHTTRLFGRDRFAALSAALHRLQRRSILSLNGVAEMRELFAWATVNTVDLSYPATGGGNSTRCGRW